MNIITGNICDYENHPHTCDNNSQHQNPGVTFGTFFHDVILHHEMNRIAVGNQ